MEICIDWEIDLHDLRCGCVRVMGFGHGHEGISGIKLDSQANINLKFANLSLLTFILSTQHHDSFYTRNDSCGLLVRLRRTRERSRDAG